MVCTLRVAAMRQGRKEPQEGPATDGPSIVCFALNTA